MLTHPADPSYTLIELADLDLDPLPPAVQAHEASLRTVADWARDYLCRPHPEIGRTGNVCPYAQGSMDRGMLYFTVEPGVSPDLDRIRTRLLGYRQWFQELSVSAGNAKMFGSILMLLPDLTRATVPAVVDRLQNELKSDFVELGLMVGEFHDGPPDKAGLWNPDFRPLHCPVPLLAIRHMVATDYLFLEEDPSFVESYLKLFAHQVPAHLRTRVFGLSR